MTGMYFSAKATALNAASLALLDTASVALRAVPIAVSLAQTTSGLTVDPTREEEDQAICRFVFGWAFGSGISSESRGDMEVDGEVEAELVWAESEGSFSRQEVSLKRMHRADIQYEDASEQSKVAAKEILAHFRTTLGDHLAKRLQLRQQ